MSTRDPVWSEEYRPRDVKSCVLPVYLKDKFQHYVDEKHVPNLLLSGKPGVGKTTVAKAMLEELGYDCLVINASLHGNIDTLRTDITQFASSVSLMGGRKYVILDEADYLNPNSTQPALRNFMDEFSKNCGFILTCNYPNRIIEPLRSRLTVVDFGFKKSDYAALMGEFYKRVVQILGAEKVEFDTKVVVQVVGKYFPDFRKVLNELQGASRGGRIDTGVLSSKTDLSGVLLALRERRFNDVRKWVGEHSDWDSVAIMREFFDQADKLFVEKSVVDLIYLIARYQYQAAFVSDQEINLTSFMAELMNTVEWK
jgi:DNA polymerase III delta prime subunit